MIIRVDPRSAVPPFDQVRAQIETMIRSGVLPPGARLPAIRQLAADLGLATGTVARAYRELEREGLIGGRGRKGTTVQPVSGNGGGVDIERRLAEAAEAFAVQARHLGISSDKALAKAREALSQTAPPQ